MVALNIDLNTKIITRQTRIWIVHPGRRRRFYQTFLENSAVFLEFPGLKLNADVLRSANLLRQRIRYSQAITNASVFGENFEEILIDEFSEAADVDVTVPLRTIRHLYGAAKVGDLVIVPGSGAYSTTLFGEITADFDPDDQIVLGAFVAPLHVRRVRWLSTNVARNELPAELARLFEKPPAVAEVQRNDSTDRFFDYAYKSYVKGEEGWAMISAPRYNGKDPRAISAPNELIVLSVALYNASVSRSDISDLDVSGIINKFYSVENIEDFSFKFASPGKAGFKASVASLALFVTVSVAAFTTISASDAENPQNVRISVQNSAGGGEDDIEDVEENISYAVNSMNPKALREAAELGITASREVDLKSEAKVVVEK